MLPRTTLTALLGLLDRYALGDQPVVLPLVAIDEKCAAVLIALIAYELDSDL